MSPWRIYRRICFKWADNTFFKIYKYGRIRITFFLGGYGVAIKICLLFKRHTLRRKDFCGDGLDIHFYTSQLNHLGKILKNVTVMSFFSHPYAFCLLEIDFHSYTEAGNGYNLAAALFITNILLERITQALEST